MLCPLGVLLKHAFHVSNALSFGDTRALSSVTNYSLLRQGLVQKKQMFRADRFGLVSLEYRWGVNYSSAPDLLITTHVRPQNRDSWFAAHTTTRPTTGPLSGSAHRGPVFVVRRPWWDEAASQLWDARSVERKGKRPRLSLLSSSAAVILLGPRSAQPWGL